MSHRRLLQITLALLAIGLAGCASDDERVSGMVGFRGRLMDSRFDAEGNLAIPGDFEMVKGESRWSERGWIVSATPELATNQLKSAEVIPGRGYFYDDRPGHEKSRQRPAPDTVVFTGGPSAWLAVPENRRPDFADTLIAPPEIIRSMAVDSLYGPTVKITYDGMLLIRQEQIRSRNDKIRDGAAIAALATLYITIGSIHDNDVLETVHAGADKLLAEKQKQKPVHPEKP